MLTVLFWLYVAGAVISGGIFVYCESLVREPWKCEYTDWRRHVEKYVMYLAYVVSFFLLAAFWPLSWLGLGLHQMKKHKTDNQA